MTDDLKPPLSARQRLSAAIQLRAQQLQVFRASDPAYLAERSAKEAAKALRELNNPNRRVSFPNNGEKTGQLAAIAGETCGNRILLSVFSDRSFCMSEELWKKLLIPVGALLNRQPEFKGFVIIGKRQTPVVGLLKFHPCKPIELHLYSVFCSKGSLQSIARGHMSGNNDVRFVFRNHDFVVDCEVLPAWGKSKIGNNDYVVGNALHASMFPASISKLQIHEASEDSPADDTVNSAPSC